jgi:hypothetical protein
MNSIAESFNFSHFNPYSLVNMAGVVFLFMLIIFGLLIFRQAIQMTQVLPTILSPLVKILVALYVVVAIMAFILGLGIIFS